jgi:hypothetical protein
MSFLLYLEPQKRAHSPQLAAGSFKNKPAEERPPAGVSILIVVIYYVLFALLLAGSTNTFAGTAI